MISKCNLKWSLVTYMYNPHKASVKNVIVWFTNESKMAVGLSNRNPSYKNFHLKKFQKIYRTGKNLYYQPVSSEGNGVSWIWMLRFKSYTKIRKQISYLSLEVNSRFPHREHFYGKGHMTMIFPQWRLNQIKFLCR